MRKGATQIGNHVQQKPLGASMSDKSYLISTEECDLTEYLALNKVEWQIVE